MTLLVGNDRDEHIIHETLLRSRSPFFASALKKEWDATQERRIPLPDDDGAVVELYLQWLYRGKLFTRPLSEDIGNDCYEHSLLVDAFNFGEKIQDEQFKDCVIDALIISVASPDTNGTNWFPTGSCVTRAYDGTPVGSPLRKLLVDFHVVHGSREWLKDENHPEFLADLAKDLIGSRRNVETLDPIKSYDSCPYHHHGKDKSCYNTASKGTIGEPGR